MIVLRKKRFLRPTKDIAWIGCGLGSGLRLRIIVREAVVSLFSVSGPQVTFVCVVLLSSS